MKGAWRTCRSRAEPPLKVLFIARSLELGGAERQLTLLACHLRQRGHAVTVALLYRAGPFVRDLEAADVHILSLAKVRRWDVLAPLMRLLAIVREFEPDVIHGYLTVPNLLAFIARMRRPRARLLWGVRDAGLSLTQYDWRERTAFRLARLLSRFVDVIVANSSAGADYYASAGFRPRRFAVIPNGIEATRFSYSDEGRRRLRREWSVRPDSWLIGIVGRLDPAKDHETFLRSAAALVREVPNTRFVCVGGGTRARMEALRELSRQLGVERDVVWAGPRTDMSDVYSALDLAVSSSKSEGFPNVVGESMACGVPCVVTAVGDSAMVVGELGEVVAPGDPEALAQACARVRNRCSRGALDREQLRAWITSEFGVERMVDRSLAVMHSSPTRPMREPMVGVEAD